MLFATAALLSWAISECAKDAKASSAQLNVYDVPSEAGYFSRQEARAARTDLTLPRIDCGSVAPGHVAGQSYGVTLAGEREGEGEVANPWAAVVVRTFCDGPRAHYEGYFIVPGATAGRTVSEVHSPAKLEVGPGEEVRLRATATRAGARLSIENLDTRKRATMHGHGFLASGAIFRVSTVSANSAGGVLGSATITETARGPRPPMIAGPVAATPALFTGARTNGRPLARAPGLGTEVWIRSKKLLAVATPILRVGDRRGFYIAIEPERSVP